VIQPSTELPMERTAQTTHVCLQMDLAAGKRVVAALRNESPLDNGLTGYGGSPELKKALGAVRSCNKRVNTVKPGWMDWLWKRLKEASTPAPVARRPSVPGPASKKPKSCRKCWVPGCSRTSSCIIGWKLLKTRLPGVTQSALSAVLEECKKTNGDSVLYLQLPVVP
jgi:hypothetical protein